MEHGAACLSPNLLRNRYQGLLQGGSTYCARNTAATLAMRWVLYGLEDDDRGEYRNSKGRVAACNCARSVDRLLTGFSLGSATCWAWHLEMRTAPNLVEGRSTGRWSGPIEGGCPGVAYLTGYRPVVPLNCGNADQINGASFLDQRKSPCRCRRLTQSLLSTDLSNLLPLVAHRDLQGFYAGLDRGARGGPAAAAIGRAGIGSRFFASRRTF